MRLTVLTLNLWNVSAPLAPRMAALVAGLKMLRPDIVCLQEVADDPGTRQAARRRQQPAFDPVALSRRAVVQRRANRGAGRRAAASADGGYAHRRPVRAGRQY